MSPTSGHEILVSLLLAGFFVFLFREGITFWHVVCYVCQQNNEMRLHKNGVGLRASSAHLRCRASWAQAGERSKVKGWVRDGGDLAIDSSANQNMREDCTLVIRQRTTSPALHKTLSTDINLNIFARVLGVDVTREVGASDLPGTWQGHPSSADGS